MSIWNGDATEFYKFAGDLSMVGARMVPALRSAMDQAGREFSDLWSDRARVTAGEHGKWYPDSIGHEQLLGASLVGVEAGPGLGRGAGVKQRNMSFEFGSRNQPAHLDGLRSLDEIEPRTEALIASVVSGTFVATTPVANPDGLREYTTKAGNTRLATPAQIANWTRGSR